MFDLVTSGVLWYSSDNDLFAKGENLAFRVGLSQLFGRFHGIRLLVL